MAAYFSLTRKNETKKLPFNKVDDEICSALHVKPSKTDYYLNWYDIIGLKIALGHSFNKIRNNVSKELLPVLSFIENNYDTYNSIH